MFFGCGFRWPVKICFGRFLASTFARVSANPAESSGRCFSYLHWYCYWHLYQSIEMIRLTEGTAYKLEIRLFVVAWSVGIVTRNPTRYLCMPRDNGISTWTILWILAKHRPSSESIKLIAHYRVFSGNDTYVYSRVFQSDRAFHARFPCVKCCRQGQSFLARPFCSQHLSLAMIKLTTSFLDHWCASIIFWNRSRNILPSRSPNCSHQLSASLPDLATSSYDGSCIPSLQTDWTEIGKSLRVYPECNNIKHRRTAQCHETPREIIQWKAYSTIQATPGASAMDSRPARG